MGKPGYGQLGVHFAVKHAASSVAMIAADFVKNAVDSLQ